MGNVPSCDEPRDHTVIRLLGLHHKRREVHDTINFADPGHAGKSDVITHFLCKTRPNLPAMQRSATADDAVHVDMALADAESILQQIGDIRDCIRGLDALTDDVDNAYRTQAQQYAAPKMSEARSTTQNLEDAFRHAAISVRNRLDGLGRLPGLEDHDKRVVATHRAALLDSFRAVLVRYKSVQDARRREQYVAFAHACRVVRPDIDDDAIAVLAAGQPDSLFADPSQAEAGSEQIKSNHCEIVRLGKDLQLLHDLFIEAAVLIDDQSGMIDNIQKNTLAAADHAGKARRIAAEAEEIQQSTRTRKICICVWILLLLPTMTE